MMTNCRPAVPMLQAITPLHHNGPKMLTFAQALLQIEKHTAVLKGTKVPISRALGLVLSRDITAPEPFPSFDNSAVDGYALPHLDQSTFKVQGEIRAGDRPRRRGSSKNAFRIFTGAPVPAGTAAVVMQEDTQCNADTLAILKMPRSRANIRFRGEDFRKADLLLTAGMELGPQHLALLAAVGIGSVPVIPAARVNILATGSELAQPNQRLKPGKIRSSNTVLLESMVRKLGATPTLLPTVADDPRAIRSRVERGLRADVLLISGGVSVGKYDHVKAVLARQGVREIFWKVDIKPGKPLYFGKAGRTLVFGLPGNPVSVFVTFEEFVRPAILKLMGRDLGMSNDNPRLQASQGPQRRVNGSLTHDFANGSRLHFVRVHCVLQNDKWFASPLEGQQSHRLGALAQANGIMKVEPHAILRRGQPVQVELV